MSRWVVRMCAAAGWLDVVDPGVVATYLERSTAVVEREPERSGQGQPSVPGIPPWVWATTGICVATAVLLVMPYPLRVERGLEPESGFETPAHRPAIPPAARQPSPTPPSTVPEPDVAPGPSSVAPSAPLNFRDDPSAEAAAPPSSVDTAHVRDQAEFYLEVALDRLGEVTRVERGRVAAPRAWDIGVALGGVEAEPGPIGVAAAVRIGERIQPVWIELELGRGSGATLRIQKPSSKPETIGKWASLAKARPKLGDSLIRWYRRQISSRPRETDGKQRDMPSGSVDNAGF